MNLNLSALKKSSSKDLLAKLAKHSEDQSAKKTSSKDERFWNPTIDEAGNGSAIIRFLPAKTDESFPYVKLYKHSFQENGKWFIANCPSTMGYDHPCPACEDNKRLWATKLEADQDLARKHKRKLSYIANVLVVKDPGDPANEGTVRLFKFGQKIFEKIEECYKVDPELGEDPVNPFSFFDSVNFNMKIQTVSKFLNYDKCKFVSAPDLFEGNEEKLVEVMEKLHDLDALVAPDQFKSYENLKERFDQVISGKSPSKKDDDDNEEFEQSAKKPAAEKFEQPEKASAKNEPAESASSDDDDDLAFFRGLAS